MNGVDLLGLGSKHWPIARTLHMVPAGTAIGCFWGTFGNVKKNLSALLDTGRFPVVRIHPPWRNHAINPAWEMKRVAKKVNKFAAKYPTIQFYLSGGCEHYETEKKRVRKNINIIKKYAERCIPVNCPCGPGVTVSGCVTEKHDHRGNLDIPQPYIVSNDGIDVTGLDVAKYKTKHKHRSLIWFLWSCRDNLCDIGPGYYAAPKDRKTPPKKRTKEPRRRDFQNKIKHF